MTAATKAAPFKLFFARAAQKEWDSLDGSVAKVFKKLLAKRLQQPHMPGSALKNKLRGHYKIKLSTIGYRLVYAVDDKARSVTVLAVGLRDDLAVYKAAVARLSGR